MRRWKISAADLRAPSAQEENPPAGRAPICWRLLSSAPRADAAAAITALRRYRQRWQIERCHKIRKSGCRIEARQLESAERIGRRLAPDVIPSAALRAPASPHASWR